MFDLAVLFFLAPEPPTVASVLEKISEEAEILFYQAPKVIGEETLQHRGRKNPPRFRPRVGAAALEVPKPRYAEKVIVSEYGFASFKEAPDQIREFRQVTSVDGRKVKDSAKARQTLAVNMRSDDDRLRKRMLEDFEKHGMVGAASDIGLLLLSFRRRFLGGIEFTLGARTRLGAEEVLQVRYRQKASADGARVFHGREMTRVAMSGQIWVRVSDYLPLRVTFTLPSKEDSIEVVHSGHADYSLSAHNVLLPAAVVYEKQSGGETLITNRAAYARYKMFKVDADVKFTPAEEPPK